MTHFLLQIPSMPPATTVEHWQILFWGLLIIATMSLMINARLLWRKEDEQKKTNQLLLKYVQQNSHIIQNINDRVAILEKYHQRHHPEEDTPIKSVVIPEGFGITE